MSDVAVITGASAGVGRAIAREFAANGFRVGLLARDSQRLQEAIAEIEAAGGVAAAIPTDVADAEQVEAAAAQMENVLGSIDVWVNNAMSTVFAPFHETTAAEFKRATEVTYLGCVYGTMSALRRMRPRNHGTIIQVGSALAYRSIPLQAAYCGAKHAIVGFTDSLRCELLHEDSRIVLTMVHLPAMNTPQFSWCRSKLPKHPQPVPPIFQPEVAARAIYWASQHPRREFFLGFPTLKAIVGHKIAPSYADRYLAKNGLESQQTEVQVDSNRADNLFHPVPGDWSAKGIFSSRATSHSTQWWLNTHRTLVAVLSVGLLALVIGAVFVLVR